MRFGGMVNLVFLSLFQNHKNAIDQEDLCYPDDVTSADLTM